MKFCHKFHVQGTNVSAWRLVWTHGLIVSVVIMLDIEMPSVERHIQRTKSTLRYDFVGSNTLQGGEFLRRQINLVSGP